jgi:hypothetical protein
VLFLNPVTLPLGGCRREQIFDEESITCRRASVRNLLISRMTKSIPDRLLVVAGLAWFFLSKAGNRFRPLGWAYLIIIAVIKLLHGKTYYPMPFYPILLAAGGVALGQLLLQSKKGLRVGYLALLVISGLLMLPFGVPVLPLETLLRYQNVISLENVGQVERDSGGQLHQLYADMLG